MYFKYLADIPQSEREKLFCSVFLVPSYVSLAVQGHNKLTKKEDQRGEIQIPLGAAGVMIS